MNEGVKRQTSKLKDLELYDAPSEKAVLTKESELFVEPYVRAGIGQVRRTWGVIDRICGQCERTATACRTAYTNTYNAAQNLILNDFNRDHAPKATAISLAGMGGIVMGYQRASRWLALKYSTAAVVLTTSFCYPDETWTLLRNAAVYCRNQWRDFKEPVKQPVVEPKASGDMDMYTTRSSRI